ELCDALGIYKRPINVVIDRQGFVRYAGLNARGLQAAVRGLLDEVYDPSAPAPSVATEEPAKTEARVEWPKIEGTVAKALDVRGRRAPELAVNEWINGRPDAHGKVVMIDFWATWCGPCVQSIPHLNTLADKFRNDLVIVGLSDEDELRFEDGLRKRNLRHESFRYPIAIDNRGRMKKALQVRAIPHAIVMSSDWVVRWQGHPAGLDEKTMEQIVKANAAAGDSGGRAAPKRGRWQKELAQR
ncbi:MAG: TlpA family protein disulfide reductase, partial [Planctomycetota bacterium]